MAAFAESWKQLGTGVRDFVRRHWQRALLIRDRIRLTEETLHLLLAAGVGLIGGLVNLVFHHSNVLLQWLVTGQSGDVLKIATRLNVWERLLIPTVGGLLAGLTLYLGLRLLGTPGLTNLLEAVVAGDGRLPLRTALVNAASSILSISTGASIGREGLITQLSATLASKCGQWANWPPYRLRLLVACGSAAGIAAAYNAPIAGAIFAAQIVLGNFSMNLFAPLLVSSVVAAMMSRAFFGLVQWYEVPRFDFTSLTQLPWFILLGIFSGFLGAGFLRALRESERMFTELKLPLYVRIAIAGLIVGGIAVFFPEVWGNGYAATNKILHQITPGQEVAPSVLIISGILLAKFVATTSTVGAGTVGGVFTPTLFLGACLGSLFGTILHSPEIKSTLPTGAFALVGMGSMLAATTHSPLLAIVVIFELSLNYSVMPPLMLACAISTLIARRFYKESVYTEPLRRKGVELERENSKQGTATQLTVGDIMRAPVPPLRENTTFREIADRFLTCSNNFLPVVDEKKRLLGMVALHDLKEWLNAGHELQGIIAYDLMRPPPNCLMPSQRLADVLPVLLGSEVRNVPVVNSLNHYQLVGTVARAEALGMLSEAISARSNPAA
ncbi:MAG TPA: ClcB-like voltage-gated chloride channel protein [Verrucomicrobiae bacterium]